MSSAVGRAGTLELRVVRPESWTLGPRVSQVESRALHGAHPKSWTPHGARSKSAKQATKELRRA
jgi:hypothetical protein